MLTAPWLGDLGQAAFYRQIAQADQRYTDEIEPRYPTLDLPVQVVWGTEDTWIPVDRAHRLAALIPGARLDLVPDAGHLIQLDAPEHLTAVLARWLAMRLLADGLSMARSQRGGVGRAEGGRGAGAAARGLLRLLHGHPGRHHRERGGARDRARPGRVAHRPAVDRGRLHGRLRGPAAVRRGAGRPLGAPPGVLPRRGPVHRLVPRLRGRGEAPSRSRRSACSRAAAPPCWCPARWPCCSRSTARRRPGRGPSGCGARSRAWRPPRARSSAGC